MIRLRSGLRVWLVLALTLAASAGTRVVRADPTAQVAIVTPTSGPSETGAGAPGGDDFYLTWLTEASRRGVLQRGDVSAPTTVLDGRGDALHSTGRPAGFFPSSVDINGVQFGFLERPQSLFDANACGLAPSVTAAGLSGNARVVCPGGAQPLLRPGRYVYVSMGLGGGPLSMPPAGQDVPLLTIYGFAFDSDRDPANNFVPFPEFPLDSAQNTDRLFEGVLLRAEGGAMPRGGLLVTDLSRGLERGDLNATSGARVVFLDNSVTLFAPLQEVASNGGAPLFRVFGFGSRDGEFEPEHSGKDVLPGPPCGEFGILELLEFDPERRPLVIC